MEKILVTGPTGATGNNTIQQLLLSKHVAVRALVYRADNRSEALGAQGVEVVLGDLTDFNSVDAALSGITTAFFLYPVTVPGILDAAAYFAQAASEAKVELIVNMSQRTARREAKSHAAQNHWISERLFDRSGVPVTHLRPTLFAEWLMYFAKEIKENSRLIMPFGNARYAPIASEDIGRVVASMLTRPGAHAGNTYPLFGPVELTQYEIAEMLSTVLQRKITYMPVEIDAFAKILEPNFTPYFVQHTSAIAQDFRDGILEGINNNVEEITGQKPLDMMSFIKKNIELFK
jgi:NAD(P)H dehydrogenase (quinone)